VSAVNGKPQVLATFTATVAAPLSGPLPYDRPGRRPEDPESHTQLGFAALAEGTLVAVDLLGGGMDGPRIEWRANLGGRLDRKPVAAADAVFAAGEEDGVAQLDVRNGDLIWRTAPAADRLLAVNEEFAYVWDRLDNLLVYDRRRPTDPVTRRTEPLARLDLSGFNFPVTNHKTDRIILASDGGVMVCLRDASAKYVRPYRIAPTPQPPTPAQKEAAAEPVAPEDTTKKEPPKKEEPKKVEPKKEEPKKDEPKKEEPAG